MTYHNENYGSNERTNLPPLGSRRTKRQRNRKPFKGNARRTHLLLLTVITAVSIGVLSMTAEDSSQEVSANKKENVKAQLVALDLEQTNNRAALEKRISDGIKAIVAKQEAERLEVERVEAERREAERIESERVAAEEAERNRLSATSTTTTTTNAQPQYVEPPTESTPVGGGDYGIPPDSYWDRMAMCETGGNWAHFPYGTWTGGLGIYNQTWRGWGGLEFAPTAGQATREQQIIVANRIATQGYGNLGPVGYSAWGCLATVGYP